MNTPRGADPHRPFPGAGLLFLAAWLLLFAPAGPVLAEENACIRCHTDLAVENSAPVTLWRESIHAENNISCEDCHGGDPKDADNAMDPARGFLGAPRPDDIPAFCGRCHVGVLKDFLASPHGQALGSGGPTCVTCHANHRVLKASLALINAKSCSRCHTFARARLVHDAMARTEAGIVTMDTRIGEFKSTGTDTETLEKRLFAVRNSFHSLSHEVDVGKVTAASARIGADLARIETSLDELTATQRNRRVAGGMAVSALLVMALLLHLLRKTYD